MNACKNKIKFKQQAFSLKRSKLSWLIAAILSGLLGSYLLIASHADTPPVGQPGSTTSAPVNLEGHGSVAYNGYVYILGGVTPIDNQGKAQELNTVYVAKEDAEGKLLQWQATTSLPSSIDQVSRAFAYNGYLYAYNAYHGYMWSAKVKANGLLGSWTGQPPLAGCRLAQAGRYLYCEGGLNNINAQQPVAVYFATFGDNGALSSWTATSAPGGTLIGSGFTASGEYVYQTGGYSDPGPQDNTATNAVYFAPINGDGTLGPWQLNGSGMPVKLVSAQSVAYGGYLYVLGGTLIGPPDTIAQTSSYYAPIGTDGRLGAWVKGPDFPSVSAYSGLAVDNGHLYLTGGQVVGYHATNAVYYSSLSGNNGLSASGTGAAGTGTGQAAAGAKNSGSASSSTPAVSPNPTTTASPQGSQTKSPAPQPSPFYDGKQYAPGSDQDTIASAAARRRISQRWLVVVAVPLAAVSGFVVWKRRHLSKK